MRNLHVAAAAALTLALGACANKPELLPAPGAAQPAAMTASAEAAGVRLVVNTDAWRGIPADLGDNFAPVLVTITNDGTEPVRVRYADLVLSGPSGEMYHAVPPFSIDESVSVPLTETRAFDGFLVAPYLSRYYPRLRAFSDPFLFDEVYFNRYHPSFVRIELPTGDMIQKALPEGVLEPGGRVSGFLYFEDPDDDVGRVTLKHTLMTPTGQALGNIEIPFDTR